MITNKIDKNVKKIPLDKFVMCYARQANDILKQKYFDDNIKLIREYIEVEEKKKIIENIIYDENGTLRSSIDRYIWFNMILINVYTNLDFGKKTVTENYDFLNQNYLLDFIIATIVPKKEYNEMKIFLEVTLNDIEKSKKYN